MVAFKCGEKSFVLPMTFVRGMRKRWEGLGGCFAIFPKSVLRCFGFCLAASFDAV